MSGERKFIDTLPNDGVDFIVSSGLGVILQTVNQIAEGTDESSRIGRLVVIDSISYRFTTYLDEGANADQSDVIRVSIYLDHQCNGNGLAAGNLIYEDSSFPGFRVLNNIQRFKILCSMTFAVNNTGSSSTQTHTTRVISKQLKGIIVEFDNSFTTGVLSTIRSNNIGILYESERGKVHIAKGSIVRCTFHDG